jgi:hypothetical protein
LFLGNIVRVPTFTGIAGRFTKIFRSDPHHFLGNVRGVVHVGANAGQERNLYAQYGLNVLWVEPIPDVFAELTKNIAKFPKQKAVNRLVTDKDGVDYPFHITTVRL